MPKCDFNKVAKQEGVLVNERHYGTVWYTCVDTAPKLS